MTTARKFSFSPKPHFRRIKKQCAKANICTPFDEEIAINAQPDLAAVASVADDDPRRKP
jgi:hypothetical protein